MSDKEIGWANQPKPIDDMTPPDKAVKPPSFPWDDDPGNNDGWYDKAEMDVYLAQRVSALTAANKQLQQEKDYSAETHYRFEELNERFSAANEKIGELEIANAKLGHHFENCNSDKIVTLNIEITALKSRLALAKGALEFYGALANWGLHEMSLDEDRKPFCYFRTTIKDDSTEKENNEVYGGKRAREALAKIEGE